MKLRDLEPWHVWLIIVAMIVIVFAVPTWLLRDRLGWSEPWTLIPVAVLSVAVIWFTTRWWKSRAGG